MGLNALRPTAITETSEGSAQTMYTAPSGGAVVRRIRITNTDSTERDVHVYVTDTAGSSASASNKFMTVTIPAGGWYDDDSILALMAADTIKAHAETASVITMTLAIMEL